MPKKELNMTSTVRTHRKEGVAIVAFMNMIMGEDLKVYCVFQNYSFINSPEVFSFSP